MTEEPTNAAEPPDREATPTEETRAVPPGEVSANEDEGASRCKHQQPLVAPRARKDKNRLHATRHGVLSRYPLEALVRRGVNVRQLRKIEKLLRAELKPSGIVAEILFDRAWSSYLRCILIACTETRLLMSVDELTGDSDSLPRLREAALPTLVWSEPGTMNYDFSEDVARHLGTVLRYDSHFSREFYRAVGLLLALRSGGVPKLLDCL